MDTELARQQMIQQQIRTWEVFDPEVLDVFGRIHREAFVPEAFRSLAFADTEIPIGHGEAMLKPLIEGRILEAVDATEEGRVLEIGTGTGYLTACLAELAGHVTSIDIHVDFIKAARQRLAAAGVDNVTLDTMDATLQLPGGPFDVVVVSGSIERFDPRFVEILNPGGRLFVVVGEAPVMEARLVTRRSGSDWHSESLFETCLRPLVNGARPDEFLF
jgi:protein-L-isoaspartate(D-aspartate) O-methyltransferase